MDYLVIYFLLVLTFILAAVSVLQFYKGRRINLKILEHSIRAMEKIFDPKDKNYTIIGIYVGYTAFYKIYRKTLSTIHATVLLLPRQSLLYMPIARLTSRHDKVYLIFNYNREMIVEAHVVKKGYYRLGVKRAIKNIEKMKVEKTKINGKDYYLIYTQKSMAQKLVDYISSLKNPHMINHVAVVPKLKRLYVAARLDKENLNDFLRKTYELAMSLA
ncbi:hypothetical protein J4526_08425 [Desulfurococcaceae archaeon MEX13E-LK6-19]|nr:hypothetical protein J4526_08425 [Desulfurococcaceae archaeon MEX13E-LK6-19]